MIMKKMKSNKELKILSLLWLLWEAYSLSVSEISYRRDLHSIIQKSFKIQEAVISDLITSLIFFFFFKHHIRSYMKSRTLFSLRICRAVEQLLSSCSWTDHRIKQLRQVLQENITNQMKQVIGKSQYQFNKGKSCLTYIINFCDKTTSSVNTGRAIEVVYLVFSKTFNTVSHSLHLDKLRRYILDGWTAMWVGNCLTGHTQDDD